MKLLSLTTIGLATATPYKEESYRVRRDDEKQLTKRYFQLEDISEKVFSFNGQKWDDKKYWDYGCHCLLLGDRPMSEMGVGTPKDDLDKVCKKYKMCQKCVRDKHGDKCIGEAVSLIMQQKNKETYFLYLNSKLRLPTITNGRKRPESLNLMTQLDLAQESLLNAIINSR